MGGQQMPRILSTGAKPNIGQLRDQSITVGSVRDIRALPYHSDHALVMQVLLSALYRGSALAPAGVADAADCRAFTEPRSMSSSCTLPCTAAD